MSMFNDISYGTKDNERECLANANVVSIYAKKFGIGLFLQTSSVFTEESQKYVKSMNPFPKERGDRF